MDYRLVVALIFAGFAFAELVAGRLLFRRETTAKDIVIELGSGVLLPILVVPGVLTASSWLTESLWPGSADRWAHWPPAGMFLLLLFVDDLAQYLWHRLSHSVPALYRLHRAHHSAEYLSVRVTYRNNLIYYALMPSLWLSGALLHLGFGAVYAAYYIAKMSVIVGAHSSVPWDAPLYASRWTAPLMRAIACVISTPMTHSAHHGRHADDGVTHYKGNYGNFLFLWDIVFRTAKMSSRRPEQYGLEKVEPMGWFRELVWPFGAQRKANSIPAP